MWASIYPVVWVWKCPQCHTEYEVESEHDPPVQVECARCGKWWTEYERG